MAEEEEVGIGIPVELPPAGPPDEHGLPSRTRTGTATLLGLKAAAAAATAKAAASKDKAA